MHRFERSLQLDNILFLLVLFVTAAFLVDQYLRDEQQKSFLAQAKALRESSEAHLLKPCMSHDYSTQFDVNGSCALSKGDGK